MVTKTKTTKKQATKKVTKAQPKKQPDIRKKITELRETIEQSWFELSILLAEVYKNETFKEWGYEKFDDYVKDELNLEYRSAMYRVKLGEVINTLGITKEQVADLGWTKFKEITPILVDEELGLTKKNIDSIIKAVKDLSYRETKELVKKVKSEKANKKEVQEEAEKVKKYRRTFSFNEEQNEIVEEAINIAKEKIETDNDSLALEYICAEWLSQQMGEHEDNDEIEIELDE